MEMHKVVFYKACYGQSYDELPEEFFRYVELPFVPFVGLEVRGEWGTVGPAERVKYDLEKGVFWCTAKTDERLPQYAMNRAPETEQLTPAQVYEFLELQGWERFRREHAPWFWPGKKNAEAK